MKKLKILFFGFIFVCCFLFFTGCSQIPKKNSLIKQPMTITMQQFYPVERVVDGDTIIVKIDSKKQRVRMIGIDTPESVKPNSPVEKYGVEASKFTKKLLNGKEVRLEFDVQKKDKYNRLLAYIYLKDGRMVNKILLKEGYAQIMTIPPNVKYQSEFLKLERQAREEKKGLWQ